MYGLRWLIHFSFSGSLPRVILDNIQFPQLGIRAGESQKLTTAIYSRAWMQEQGKGKGGVVSNVA